MKNGKYSGKRQKSRKTLILKTNGTFEKIGDSRKFWKHVKNPENVDIQKNGTFEK